MSSTLDFWFFVWDNRNMKKILLSVFLLFVALSAFASASIISVSFSPYSEQKIVTNSGINDNSFYGFGAKIGYGYKLSDSFTVGLKASYSRFSYEKLYNNEKYDVLSFLAKAGYSIKLYKIISLYADLGAGIDVRMLHKESKVNPSLGAYVGFDFLVSKTVIITTGADMKLGIQSKSKDLALVTNVGVAFTF